MVNARAFEYLGSHPMEGDNAGVRFTAWVPNAKRVAVVGDFNGWDAEANPLACIGDSGNWQTVVAQAKIGDRYKFHITDACGNVLPLKADPYARASEYRPATASIVSAMPPKRPLLPERCAANRRHAPISIYEIHAGSWKRHADGRFYSWDDLANSLPQYVKNLGFTHIELLPITEYPFDGSWGYQTLGQFSCSARFGSHESFARFVDVCHRHSIGVIVDWVPAHFPSDAHGLANFNGTPMYEYADPKEGFHRDWNTLIYDFGRYEVRDFLASSALYWAERFGIDGLRVDAVASMLYRDYSRNVGEWVPNVLGGRENLEAISLLKEVNEVIGSECDGVITIAEESTAFPKVTAPTYENGLGFHYKWNMGWMNDTLQYMQEDPIHRRWHHSKMTFGLTYGFSENFVLPLSHDEVVHGKGSMLAKMPGDNWQRFANLRAYYGFMWGHPGKKLLFMGQEFGQPYEWNHDAELPWHLVKEPDHQGVCQLITDLNSLYCKHGALHELDCDPHGFEWLIADDNEQSVFAWLRRNDAGDSIIVVSNFTPVIRENYRIGVSGDATSWREILNTDSSRYGGSNVGNRDAPLLVQHLPVKGSLNSISVTLPPLATIFLIAQR
jgi:1,4-alpha-glucan branching enzyme